jgi:hypothetical protein
MHDECGDWSIYGSKGNIYTDGGYGPNWYLYIAGNDPCTWSFAKKTLSFMTPHVKER